MRTYRISNTAGEIIGNIKAANFYHAAMLFAGSDKAVERLTGYICEAGFWWAREFGTRNFVGQPFKVEEEN